MSAIADAGLSAGWQQPNSRSSESSACDASAGSTRLHRADELLAASSRVLAAVPVHQLVLADDDQPAARVVRHPVRGPLRGGRQQRVLQGVLGVREVPGPADEHAEDLRRQLAQQVLDGSVTRQERVPPSGRGPRITCRIGAPSGPGAADALAAISIARASSSTSTVQ